MVQRYIGGEDKLFGPLMGVVMKAMAGKGNPAVVKTTIQTLLAEMKHDG